MAKPMVLLGIEVDATTWKTLLEVEKFDDVEALGFIVETSRPLVWLRLVGENQVVLERLHDITTKAGGLAMKMAGGRFDSAEMFHEYLWAAARATRLEVRLRDANGLPKSDYFAAKEEHAAAIRARDSARDVFETAVKRDTEMMAKWDDDDFPDSAYEYLGPPN